MIRDLATDIAGDYRLLDQRTAVQGLILETIAERGVVYLQEHLGFRLFLIPAFIFMVLLYLVWEISWKGLF